MDIKETTEMMDFATETINDAATKKENDGKIDLMEALQVAGENAPAAVKAVMGADKIDDELKDLDPEEIKTIAGKGLELTRAVTRLMKA